VNKADEDCLSARCLLRQRSYRVFNAICFHSHQCVEKYLKAFLTLRQVKFPKTHDLIILHNLASEIDSSLELIKDLTKGLNIYAVQFRYPGEDADRKEAKMAVKAMEECRKVFRQKI